MSQSSQNTRQGSRKTSRQRTIGRAASCDLVIEHASVSRRHAHLERASDGRLWLDDAGSLNGTWLQREGQWIRIERINVCRGDLIRFGDSEVEPAQLLTLFGAESRVWLPRLPEVLARGRSAAETPAQAHGKVTRFNKPRRNPVTGQIEENTP